MSKHDKNEKNDKYESDILTVKDIMEEQEKLERKRHKLMIPCSHTNSNGKLKVDFISGNKVRCKKCGAEFSFDIINNKELEKSVENILNAINQIKAMSDNPDKEKSLIVQLGNMAYNLKEFTTLYGRTVSKYGKHEGKKKKNKHNNDFGSFGINSVEFIPSGGKRNKY